MVGHVMKSKRNKTKGFDSLSNILPNVLKNFRHSPDEQLLQVFEVWDRIVGEKVSQNAQPSAFKGKLLLVEVNSSVWMHQLQFLKADILQKINESLGEEWVEDIKFKIGTP